MVCRISRPNANAPSDLLQRWWQLTPAKYEHNFIDLSSDTRRSGNCLRQKAFTSAVCSHRTIFAAQWNANCPFVRVDLQNVAAQIECTPISWELFGWQDTYICTNYAMVFCIIAFLYRHLLITANLIWLSPQRRLNRCFRSNSPGTRMVRMAIIPSISAMCAQPHATKQTKSVAVKMNGIGAGGLGQPICVGLINWRVSDPQIRDLSTRWPSNFAW